MPWRGNRSNRGKGTSDVIGLARSLSASLPGFDLVVFRTFPEMAGSVRAFGMRYRTNPSSSSAAQSCTALIDMPLCSLANMVGNVPRL